MFVVNLEKSIRATPLATNRLCCIYQGVEGLCIRSKCLVTAKIIVAEVFLRRTSAANSPNMERSTSDSAETRRKRLRHVVFV
jgi:hypothetical protein